MNQYEAMFLFDPTFGSSFDKCEAEIQRLMDRAEGEVILCRKWDERRLAYRIKGRKRGVYALTFFRAPAEKIVPLERDVQLSEVILRVLVLRAEDVTNEAMERAFVAWREDAPGPDGPAGKPGPDKPVLGPVTKAAVPTEPAAAVAETAPVEPPAASVTAEGTEDQAPVAE